jgi:hypothetical protein
VADRVRRSNRWFAFLCIVLVVSGMCAIGYWQTYDLRCGAGRAYWVWSAFPPRFQCPLF